jgi:hypothetical protein
MEISVRKVGQHDLIISHTVGDNAKRRFCGPQWKFVVCQWLNLLLEGGEINGRSQDDGGWSFRFFRLTDVASGFVFIATSGWSFSLTIFSLLYEGEHRQCRLLYISNLSFVYVHGKCFFFRRCGSLLTPVEAGADFWSGSGSDHAIAVTLSLERVGEYSSPNCKELSIRNRVSVLRPSSLLSNSCSPGLDRSWSSQLQLVSRGREQQVHHWPHLRGWKSCRDIGYWKPRTNCEGKVKLPLRLTH